MNFFPYHFCNNVDIRVTVMIFQDGIQPLKAGVLTKNYHLGLGENIKLSLSLREILDLTSCSRHSGLRPSCRLHSLKSQISRGLSDNFMFRPRPLWQFFVNTPAFTGWIPSWKIITVTRLSKLLQKWLRKKVQRLQNYNLLTNITK